MRVFACVLLEGKLSVVVIASCVWMVLEFDNVMLFSVLYSFLTLVV